MIQGQLERLVIRETRAWPARLATLGPLAWPVTQVILVSLALLATLVTPALLVRLEILVTLEPSVQQEIPETRE